MEEQVLIFDHVIDVCDEPAMNLLDHLFLRQNDSYELDISRKHGNWLWNCRIKFRIKYLK